MRILHHLEKSSTPYCLQMAWLVHLHPHQIEYPSLIQLVCSPLPGKEKKMRGKERREEKRKGGRKGGMGKGKGGGGRRRNKRGMGERGRGRRGRRMNKR